MMMMAYQESMENLSNGNPVNNYRDSTQVNKKNTLTKRNRLKKEKPIRFGFVYDLFPPPLAHSSSTNSYVRTKYNM